MIVNETMARHLIDEGGPTDVVVGTLALGDLGWVTPVGGGLAIYDRAHQIARNVIDALARRNMLTTAPASGRVPHPRKEATMTELHYGELPATRPGNPRQGKYERLVEQLILDDTGQWARLNTFNNPTTAASVANDLRKRHPMLAFVGVRPQDSEGSELWARVPQEDEAEAQ